MNPVSASANAGEGELLVLDACCAINLLASGEARAILSALRGYDVAVARLVVEREVLHVVAPDAPDADDDHEPTPGAVDLTLEPLVDAGLLRVVSPRTEKERETFVNLALELDDGEAMTGAIALDRGGVIATDDRKAIRVLSTIDPGLEIVRTTGLIRRWAEHARVEDEEIARVLTNIEERASFIPPRDDPLERWWQEKRQVTGG